MYKPTLKRTCPPSISAQPSLFYPLDNPAREKVEPKVSPCSPLIPSKMLEAPENNNKEKKHLVTPLMVHSHKYPPKVLERLERQQEREKSRGIGGYREISWFFQGKVLSLWVVDKEEVTELTLEEEINAVAMGELKAQYLPFKLRNKYIIAIGSLNTVTLHSLNNFALEAFPAEAKYVVEYSLQIQKIKFVDQSAILVATNTGYLKLIEFGQRQRVRGLQMPLYRRLVPVTVYEETKTVEQMLYTPSKIFLLMTEYAKKSWLKQTVEGLLSSKPVDSIYKKRYIQVYTVGSKIEKKEKLYQNELMNKVRSYVPTFTKQMSIKSIFIDYKHDKEGELGIVTDNGCFVTIRNHTFLGRQPLFAPNLGQLGECEFISKTKLELIQLNNTQSNNTKVICSLGYQNLTLLEDALLWIGDDRIDGVLTLNLMGELYQKNECQSENLLQKNQEWGLFGFRNYYTIKQVPLRHLISLFFYIKDRMSNEYSGLHYKEERFNSCLNKYIGLLGVHLFLKHLIQILLSQQRFLTINPFFLELIENQLKEEKPKQFKDWKHAMVADTRKQEIFLNERIFRHIWTTILELQNREIGSGSARTANLYESSAFWLAMHQVYHSLISPLFSFNPEAFRKNKHLVQDIHQALKSLQAFFEHKHTIQSTIRNTYTSSIGKKDILNSYDNTEHSISEKEGNWLPEVIRRSIATKALNSTYLVLQAKIEAAFRATAILMTIFYNLEDYIEFKEGTKAKLYGKLFNTTFREVLSSRETQKLLKKMLISKLQLIHLAEVEAALPSLDLERDLKYLRCRQKIKLQQVGKDNLDLREVAESISSDYFQEMDGILGSRWDLRLKMLGLYQQRLLRERDNLVQSNTLEQRYFLSRNLFPEEEEEVLNCRRRYIDRELEEVLLEEKKCITKAVVDHSELKRTHQASSSVLDQLIIYVSNKPYLFFYAQQELRANSLIRELDQLERIKPTKMPVAVFSSSVKVKPQFVRRDLFPPITPY